MLATRQHIIRAVRALGEPALAARTTAVVHACGLSPNSQIRATGRRCVSSAASAMSLQTLEPAPVFRYFLELTQIPRPSKQEQKVLEWLKAFAAEHSLTWKQDAFGNLVIFRPGSGGGEGAPPVIVQGHVDMVCEKNGGVEHNFSTDPISTYLEGGWLKAKGTTLGADNGVGVAAALALLSLPQSSKLPPLEALFTLEEEIGLNGARALDGSMLTGKTLVNLDSEDWPIIYIGCAGAGDTLVTLEVTLSDEAVPPGSSLYRLSLTGLQGGHSGLQIDQGLGNAVQLLGLTLKTLMSLPAAQQGLALVEVTGGDKRNAIAREASALLLLTPQAAAAAQEAVATRLAELQQEYGGVEPGLQLLLQPCPPGGAAAAVAVAPADAAKLVMLLCIIPHGPVRFSTAVPGLVETSTNLASVKHSHSPPAPTDPNATINPTTATYTITNTTRSSIPAALEATRARILAAAEAVGARAAPEPAYPGWAPNPASPVLQLTKKAIAGVVGREPQVTAIHAGLECGLLGQQLPGTDMVSFGPTILGAHSPDERLEVATVEPFWRVLLLLMTQLAEAKE